MADPATGIAYLDGARGNSGAILAQLLHGVGDAAHEHPLLTAAQFVGAVTRGVAYAQEALSDPREGTMLTVMRDFGAELAAQLERGCHDLATLLEHGLARARVHVHADDPAAVFRIAAGFGTVTARKADDMHANNPPRASARGASRSSPTALPTCPRK